MLNKIKLNQLNALQTFNLMRYGTVLVSAIFLSRVAENVTMINQYETLLLIGTAFTFFFVSALNQSFYAFAKQRDDFRTSNLISVCFIFMTCFTLMALVFAGLYIRFFLSPSESQLAIPFLIFILFNTPAYFIEYILLVQHQQKKLVAYGAVVNGLHLIALFLPLVLGFDLEMVVSAFIILGLLKFMYLVELVRHHLPSATSSAAKAMMNWSLPIMVSMLIGGGYMYLSFFFSKQWFTELDFSIYRYGAREFPLFIILVNAVSTIYSGQKSLKEGGFDFDGLKKKITQLIWWFLPISLGLMLASEFVFNVLLENGLETSFRIFIIFLFILPSRLLMPQTVLLAKGITKPYMLASFVELGVGLSLALWIGKMYGIEAMAWTVVISFYAEKVILMISLSRRGVGVKQYLPIGPFLILFGIMALTFWFLSF